MRATAFRILSRAIRGFGIRTKSQNNRPFPTPRIDLLEPRQLLSLPSLADLDIGSPAHAGSSTCDNSAYTVSGGGANIWNSADQFHYADEQVSGDQTIITQIASVQNTDTYAKAGVMFRDSSAAGSRFIAVVQMPNNQVTMQWRDSTNANASSTGATVGSTTSPKWVKLVRQDNSYYGYYAATTNTPPPAIGN